MSPTTQQIAPLRLGFARGVSPAKWARRWALAVPTQSLELESVQTVYGRGRGYGRRPEGETPTPVDAMIERTLPGESPEGVGGETPVRRAISLYTESIALVVAADHELAKLGEIDSGDLALVTLLDYPQHSPRWPDAEPWSDPSFMPRNAAAALALVATGLGALLLPLPLARHLGSKKDHAVLRIVGDAAPLGSTVWASWAIERDAADIQQLAGVLRGRSARSSRVASTTPASPSGSSVDQRKHSGGTAKRAPKLNPKSRGAQLAAAREKALQKKRDKKRR